MIQLSNLYMTTGKTIALTIWTFVSKVVSLHINTLSKVGHSFSPKEQVSFNFMGAVTICSDFGAQENKKKVFIVSILSICHELMGPNVMTLVFWLLNFKPAYSLSSFTFMKRLFSSSSLSVNKAEVDFFFLEFPSALLTMRKHLTAWSTTNWKVPRDGNIRQHYLSPEKPVCGSRSNS